MVDEKCCEPERMIALKSNCIVRDAWKRGCPIMQRGITEATLHACPEKDCEVYKIFAVEELNEEK